MTTQTCSAVHKYLTHSRLQQINSLFRKDWDMVVLLGHTPQYPLLSPHAV